jgi:hypothetical protein
MRTTVVILYLFLCSQVQASTFDVVLAGKKCEEDVTQHLECDYRIGKDLWIAVAGIGEATGGATFFKSDFDGDYYASFGLMHACVIVHPGKKLFSSSPDSIFDLAFISPRTGKVFESWAECKGN